MINIGFLGLGRVLDYHLPAVRGMADQFRIASVFDLSERRRTEVALELEAVASASYEEMLADPHIDVIVVATPPRFHTDHAIQALQSGKHVIVEKPMALHAKDAQRMVEAAEANSKLLVVNHNHRFSGHQQYHYIKEMMDTNVIGKPYQYNVQLMSGWGGYEGSPDYIPNWECKKEHGGGTLFSWGPHLVDMVLQAHPSEPRTVYARLNSEGWEFDGDSNSVLIITFEDGATAHIEISYVSPHLFNLFYVRGEHGSIKYEQATGNVTIKKGTIKEGYVEEVVTPEQLPPDIVYNNLYEAITKGKKLLIEPRDIHKVIAVLEAAVHSAENDIVVNMSDVLKPDGLGVV
jgi:scyllo-inositol 2-dehydrogenase (NADP+)